MCIRDRGCSLSPPRPNFIDNVVRQWKNVVNRGIRLFPSRKCPNTMLIADDQKILQKTDSDLKLAVHRLSLTCKDYNLTTSEKRRC